ncbi:armadillo-type protein [Dichotomocladium elegans]|nr:armadillo-type protein [Dichotomocladium elegans]
MPISEIDITDPVDFISHKLIHMNIERPTDLPDQQIAKEDLPTLKFHLLSSNPRDAECLHVLFLLRCYLSEDRVDRVQEVMDLHILERLHALFADGLAPHSIQVEIAWIVSNLAAGKPEHTQSVIDAGFLPLFIDCLKWTHSPLSLRTQAAWGLSNLSDNSPDIRRYLLTSGAVETVANILIGIHDTYYEEAYQKTCASQPDIEIADNEIRFCLNTLTWALACMVRGGFNTNDYWERYLPAFEAFTKSTLFDYKEVWINGCWGIKCILQNVHTSSLFYERMVISPHFKGRLHLLLCELSSKRVLLSALRVVSNISIEPTDVIFRFMDASILTPLGRLISVDMALTIRRDALLCLSNLSVGQSSIFDTLLSDHDILYDVIRNLRIPWHDLALPCKATWVPIKTFSDQKPAVVLQEWKIINESLWIIANILDTGTNSQIRHFFFHHRSLPNDLFDMIRYNVTLMPFDVSIKLIDTMTRLLQKADAISREGNPIRATWIQNGLEKLLEPAKDSGDLKLIKRCWALTCLVYNNLQATCSQPMNSVSMTAVEATSSEMDNKRRILTTVEDGDIRFLEQAVSKLGI